MATTTHTVKFAGSVTPKKTKFLTSSAFKMDFEGTLDLDEVDASKIKAIQKAFQSEMSSRIKAQLSHLDGWLKQKDQLIATMVKKHEDIKKFGFPSTGSEASAMAAKNKALEALAKEIQGLEKDYKEIVEAWATNAREQQGRICLMTALKKARAKTLNDKSWRVKAAMAIKVTLVVAAIALSIAAIVLTAGATAPIFIGLAAAGLALSGVSSIAGVGVMIKNNASTEKKILTNVQKDVKTIENALKPVAGAKTSLAKHVTELRNVMKVRLDSTKQLKADIQKKKAEIGGYEGQLVALAAAVGKQTTPDKKTLAEIASRKKNIATVKKQVQAIEKRIIKAAEDNVAAQALLDDLVTMNIDLEKISQTSGSTLGGNLKERFTSLQGWIDLGNDVGGLASGISGAHA